eukprot:TRINITY_DN1236_c0_g1_i1.p1 TRINITY_DN1236_c0_g1~~TRINITY_DN1236_c0_g1_i1.p1  ORF type:complete len:120 (-),score=44.20 TRINITY_DN1236_c0_g1_i1:131-490(-)
MSAPSLKIDVNKMSAAPSQDEESGMQHYTVRVKFTFGDSGKVVERSFSSGETGLGMKKQLFDSLSVDYGKMTLAVDGTELIDPLSICDTPALKDKKELDVQVTVPDFDTDKWQTAKWDE